MDDGLVRAIGICDVDLALLEELLQQRTKPHIIQNWSLALRLWGSAASDGCRSYGQNFSSRVHIELHGILIKRLLGFV